MYEDLVKRLNGAAGGPEGIRMCLEAAAAITDLLVENQSMRNAADVSPVRHGRWRFCGSDKWNDAYECSECGNIAMDDSNYCPNCGAKMIRGNDNG